VRLHFGGSIKSVFQWQSNRYRGRPVSRAIYSTGDHFKVTDAKNSAERQRAGAFHVVRNGDLVDTEFPSDWENINLSDITQNP
jgi:hypothetical protein